MWSHYCRWLAAASRALMRALACCSAVKAALIPGKTALVMVESPTNPRMQVSGHRAAPCVSSP